MAIGRKSRARRLLWPALIVVVATVSIGRSTRLDEPPRYDGAGYATLGRALAEGRGYRDIGHPGAPRHAHFPPGYPAALGLLWSIRGSASVPWAHLFSAACTVTGAWATWRWWLATEPRAVAGLLGLGLAANWAWGRSGGSIQSEPLYLALGGLTVLLAIRAARGRRGVVDGAALGLALGACVLTRHVGACLALAVAVDLGLRGRRAAVGSSLVVVCLMVVPWLAWQAWVGSGSQAGLFRGSALPGLVASQALFYARRIPDAALGPWVESATVFGRSGRVAWLATAFALVASSTVVLGWIRMLGSDRRRLGALIPLATLPLLVAWPFTEAGRFLVPLVPWILMGAAEGVAPIFRRLGARRARRLASALVLAASLPYACYAIVADRAGAQRRTHEGFDAACRWIAGRVDRPGPVLSRHPADVAWLAARTAVAIPDGGPGAIARAVDRFGVAYVLVDEARYANAPPTPLMTAIRALPSRFRLAWEGPGGIAVYEVDR